MKTITKFDEITIIPNSLIVLDIDETLIKFNNIDNEWWKNGFNKIYEKIKDYDKTEKILNNKWIETILELEPILVDENIHDFIECATNTCCKIILLTARDENLYDITQQQLNKLNLNFFITHHNKNKGEYLKKLANEKYSYYKDIIVVDDLMSNLIDIKEQMSMDYKLHLYNIKIN